MLRKETLLKIYLIVAGLLISPLLIAQSCTGPLSVNIPGSGTAMPLAILPSSTVQNLTCSGVADGGITVNVNGGTLGYTYSWSDNPAINSNIRTGLAAGAYTCWVTDGNGCTQQQIFNISGVPVALTASSNSPLCTGATLNLNATGSNTGNFVWTSPGGATYPVQNASIPAATPFHSGAWSVNWTSATNPSCTATQSVNVFVGPISLFATPDPIDSTLVHFTVSNCTAPYVVYWRPLQTGTVWLNQNMASNTTSVGGLQPATTYVAYAVDANGATTSIIYFTTGGVPFCGQAPTLTALRSCDKIFTDWSGGNILNSGGSPYGQYAVRIRKISPVIGPASSTYTANLSHVFTVTPANFGSTYEVTVSGMCDNQYSIVSPPVYITATDPRPNQPTNLTFSTSCTSLSKTITVNWTPPSNGLALSYRVIFKNASNGTTFANIATSLTTVTKTVAANATYEIWVVPIGCSNLQGTHSLHYNVTACSGVVTPVIRTQNPDLEEESELIEELLPESTLSVYPNPNNGTFTVAMSDILGNVAAIEVVNILGQVVYTAETEVENGNLKHEIKLDEQLSQGSYLVKVTTPQESYQTKIIKF